MQKVQHETLSFGDFTLDLSRECLRRGTDEVKLRPKSFEVLKFLMENSGRLVTKAELLETVWTDSFVTDDSLVQCLIDIRRALDDDAHRYVKTVPRRGYIFHPEVTRTDLTQQQVVYTREVEGVSIKIEEDGNGSQVSSKQSTALTARPGDSPHSLNLTRILIIGALAGTVVGFALFFGRQRPSHPQPTPISSVAVLPFKNLSGDLEQEYFSDGVTESLISTLSKLDGLRVISRGSVVRFKNQEIDPRTVGRDLGVAAVLEGSVRKNADSVRVAAHLVSVEDGRVLWSGDTYDRALGDIFALQDEIAHSLATGLRMTLTGKSESSLARHYTGDVEAYDLYMKGRFFWSKRTDEGLHKSIDYFQKAIALDPNYALAYAGMADSYVVLNLYSTGQEWQTFPRARQAAEQALKLDDSLVEAHTTLGYIHEQYDWDWPAAEREYLRAIELNPNYATAHQYYSEYLALVGRIDESIAQIKRAHELDPYSLIINTELGYPYLCKRDWDTALVYLNKALELDSGFSLAILYVARCHLGRHEFEEAIAQSKRAIAAGNGSDLTVSGLAYTYAASGKKEEARQELAELINRTKQRYVSPYLIATVYAGLGEHDEALTWLEKAAEGRDYLLVMLRVDPRLDPLRSDPRFTALMTRVGLAHG